MNKYILSLYLRNVRIVGIGRTTSDIPNVAYHFYSYRFWNNPETIDKFYISDKNIYRINYNKGIKRSISTYALKF